MKIETFTEEDIREAAHLAYPVWGEGHAAYGPTHRATTAIMPTMVLRRLPNLNQTSGKPMPTTT